MSLEAAIQHHQRGDFGEAERLYRAVLRAEPRHADAHHLLGFLFLQRGEPRAAVAAIRRSLEIEPQQPSGWLNLGLAWQQAGQHQEALDCLERALVIAPDYPEALNNRGDVLIELGRPAEALQSLERAVALQPGFAMALNNRGNALRALGRHAEALASYEEALRADPGLVRALINRGSTLRDLGRLNGALESFQQALSLDPGSRLALFNRGNLLSELGRHGEALEAYDRLLQLAPLDAEGLANRSEALLKLGRTEEALAGIARALRASPQNAIVLNAHGSILRALRRHEEALASFERAIAFNPQLATAHGSRGNVLLEMRRVHEAVESFDRALALVPDWVEALHDRAIALLRLQRLESAEQALARCLELDPAIPYARGVRLHARLQQADWRDYDALVAEVIAANERGERADEPLSFLALSGSARAQLRCALNSREDHGVPSATPLWSGRRFGHERIRVAYLSADFGEHAVSYLMAGVFEEHDRRSFEPIGVALRPGSGPYFERVRAGCERFIEAGSRSDEEVARLLREMEVDIAVDLGGYTEGARVAILAHRPAPVQLSYLGYPGTLGTSYIDYLLADAYVIPPATRAHYAERVVYLPECFQANDQRRVSPVTVGRDAAGLPGHGVVLCAFNASFKINPRLFDVWCHILRAVPQSVLWLLGGTETTRANLQREAEARGVASGRLIFAQRCSYDQHLARMTAADLYLDTQPFSAGASASDALWAGVPVITCPGEAFAARMAGSLLQALRLPELAVESLDRYERLAIELVSDPERLCQVKRTLVEQRESASLFNTARFCRHLERGYALMHERAQCGEAPADLVVEPLASD
jgi:protein O-GlcNAc transferase